MSNLETMVNAIPDVDHSASGRVEFGCKYVRGDQEELGAILGIEDLHWPHRIERAELLSTVCAQSTEPSDWIVRKWLEGIASIIGSDSSVSATWRCKIEKKDWKIGARQYDISSTHSIRTIVTDETGETDHELVDIADCDSLSDWLESVAMVNGIITIEE